jgi:hypothetical protein
MTYRPLLIFPTKKFTDRHGGPPPPERPKLPGAARQISRLEPLFSELESAFDRHAAELRDDPSGAEPDKVVVLETVGPVEDFYKAVEKTAGLQWLLDAEGDDFEPDEDFYFEEKGQRTEKHLPRRAYLVMSNKRGLDQLVALFRRFKEDRENVRFARGQGRWRYMFQQLHDIRFWGPQDRLEGTGILEDWQALTDEGSERIRTEVELWFRKAPASRRAAEQSVKRLIRALNGDILSSCVIDEIRYHALLAEIPIGHLESLVGFRDVELVKCDHVMYLRPQSRIVTGLTYEQPEEDTTTHRQGSPAGEPVVALLDGLPLTKHKLLDGRLVIDDPDDYSATYEVRHRRHGTAMASLIIHGDLAGEQERSLLRPVYTRPIMSPVPGMDDERVPADTLVVDLFHRAVHRIFSKEGIDEAICPSIRVINLSVADWSRPFMGSMSPWARLLDYLSFKYAVLFVVSAGNYHEIELGNDGGEPAKMKPDKREEAVLCALQDAALRRQLLSPAEAINAITVGALHADKTEDDHTGPAWHVVDPYSSQGMPSPLNAQGPGFRGAVKPEVLANGGRQLFRVPIGHASEPVLKALDTPQRPGQRVAAAGSQPGRLDGTIFSRGTSNACALVTRAAADIYEVVQDLRNDPSFLRLQLQYSHLEAAVVKALLVHSTSWGSTRDVIEKRIGDRLDKSKRVLTRLLGYGSLSPERVEGCTEERATLIGCDFIKKDQAHRYAIPLPPALGGWRGMRRLVVTLAWLSPIAAAHQRYRRARLWFEPYGDTERVRRKFTRKENDAIELLGLKRKDVDTKVARRGTIQHEVFEGERATSFPDDAELHIQVNCSEDAGTLQFSVPYSLVVTLEVAEGVGISIYDEVRQKLQPKVRVEPARQ